MNRLLCGVLFLAPLLALPLPGVAQNGTCAGMSLGPGASLNGFVPFPKNDPWNQKIKNAPVDPNSTEIIALIGATTPLHPDFGSGKLGGSEIGIPYQVVSHQKKVNIKYTQSKSESDPGPMPIPANAEIEGYPKAGGSGDRHVLVLDRDNCFLYELYDAKLQANGSWNAGSGAVWNLKQDNQRPYTWTSADAAGLPIFPGLVRYDEVASGAIHHALRFTLRYTKAAIVPPAKHWAANSTAPFAAPMGMRLRLKADFDISGFSATNQVILKALKTYGMILADNGSPMYISGAPNKAWSNDDLHNLTHLTASDFVVIDESPLYTPETIPTGPKPTITKFTASPRMIRSGATSMLSWSGNGGSYFIVSPQVGVVRGQATIVKPTKTTTYTLYSTNQYGRTKAKVTLQVIVP